MENLSQLVTQEDYLGLQVLCITHHCYGLNTGPAGISPAKLHNIVGAASRYRTP
jgi:hypothetical protein